MRKNVPITLKFFPRHFIFLKNKLYKWFLPNKIIKHPSSLTRFNTKFSIINFASIFNTNKQFLDKFAFQKKRHLYTLRLFAKQFAYISFAEIDSAYRAIKRLSKRLLKNRVFLRSYPFMYLTKKPAEVRMGKGKGNKIRDRICPIRPGKIIFELKQVPFRKGIYSLMAAQKKLSILTGILKKSVSAYPRKNRLYRHYTIF